METKYNYEVGKLHDTVFYIVMCLFEEEMIERIFEKYSKTADPEYDMRFYNELKDKCPSISTDLIPFCYCNSQQSPFLGRYISDNINFDNGTFQDLTALLSDKEKSKKYFIDFYFPKLSKSDRQKLYQTKDIRFIHSIVTNSEITPKYQVDFLAFLSTFDTYIPLLIETVETIYSYVDYLHKRNSEFIKNIINQLTNPAVNAKEILFKYFALKEEKQIVYMFSLLNPYCACYSNKSPFHHPFRVGEKFLTTLSYESDYKHITFESFAKTILSPAKYEIFRMFFKYRYLCAGDIIDATKLSRYIVYAHLNDMHTENLIIHINVGGSTLRYSLNENYLYKYIEYMTKEADIYVDLKRKDELKHYVRPRKRRKDAQY